MSAFNGMIESIGTQQDKVTTAIEAMKADDIEASELLKLSLTLMQEQQRLTILSDSFSKTMKAHTDSQKAAINNMH